MASRSIARVSYCARQQHRLLEYHADFATRARHYFSIDGDLALAGTDQARNHHEQSALAATAGPEQAQEFAVGDVERDVSYRFEIVIEFAHGLDAQHR
jgi:hypothetical protein